MTFETFERENRHFAQMQEVAPKTLGIRKKIRLFKARKKNELSAIVALTQKSRVLLKDVAVLESIVAKMAVYGECSFDHKVLLIEAPLCSKARSALQDQGWDIH